MGISDEGLKLDVVSVPQAQASFVLSEVEID